VEIDLNCDLGESYGNFKVGNDEAVFPFLSSCNIACGAHGGDPLTIEKTIQLVKQYNVQIGAHPSYPDLEGFGIRKMTLSPAELSAQVKTQIAVIDGLCRSYGIELKYVKAHGALYNHLNQDAADAQVFTKAISEYSDKLAIMGLPNSTLHQAAKHQKVAYIREGFIDRLYQADGSLSPRSEKGAVFDSIDQMIEQFKSIVINKSVKASDGNQIDLDVDSLCIHGDNPKITSLLTKLTEVTKLENITIRKSLTS